MHSSVHDAVSDDHDARQLVKVDVVIKWQHRAEAAHAQLRDARAQHQHQHPGAVEVQALAWTTKNHEYC